MVGDPVMGYFTHWVIGEIHIEIVIESNNDLFAEIGEYADMLTEAITVVWHQVLVEDGIVTVVIHVIVQVQVEAQLF